MKSALTFPATFVKMNWAAVAGLYYFATGRKDFQDQEGTWRDAEDGMLGGGAITEGSVDSTVGVFLNLAPQELRHIDRIVVDDEWAVRERVWADGRDDDGVHRRIDDGAAGRKVVGGRTCGRRDDQAIGAEAVDELPVEPRLDLDDARERRLADDHVV